MTEPDYRKAIGQLYESTGHGRYKHQPRYRIVDVMAGVGDYPYFLMARVDSHSKTEPEGFRRQMTVTVFEGFNGSRTIKFRKVKE